MLMERSALIDMTKVTCILEQMYIGYGKRLVKRNTPFVNIRQKRAEGTSVYMTLEYSKPHCQKDTLKF